MVAFVLRESDAVLVFFFGFSDFKSVFFDGSPAFDSSASKKSAARLRDDFGEVASSSAAFVVAPLLLDLAFELASLDLVTAISAFFLAMIMSSSGTVRTRKISCVDVFVWENVQVR